MNNFSIRPLRENEVHLLEEFIYQAIFQREGDEPLPRSIINDPTISVYIRDYGRQDDNCLVAEIDGAIVGAVWTRILNGSNEEHKGFGNLDDQTPEFAISLMPEARGKGIGTALMTAMLNLLQEKGYQRASLAVQKDNYAVKIYQKVGFKIIDQNEEEYIMLVNLCQHNF